MVAKGQIEVSRRSPAVGQTACLPLRQCTAEIPAANMAVG